MSARSSPAGGRLLLASALFLSILCAQFLASASKRVLYPLNAYRMYATRWGPGTQLLRVLYEAGDGKVYRPWDLLRIPFFQANRASYETFLGRADERQKQALCELLLEAAGAEVLRVRRELLLFELSAEGTLGAQSLEREIVHECRKFDAAAPHPG